MNLIAELKRRNVIRMAGLYLVGAWLDLVRLPFDPVLDPLRTDPRFDALVRKMGFPK